MSVLFFLIYLCDTTFSFVNINIVPLHQVEKIYVKKNKNIDDEQLAIITTGPYYKSLGLSDQKDTYLDVEGIIPEWLEGSHIRVGPAMFKFGNEEVVNWFDGQSMLCRFHFSQKGIHYTNKFLDTKNIRQHLRHGKVSALEFGSCPKELKAERHSKDSLFHIAKRLHLMFSEYQNNNVNCFKFGEHYVALSETKTYMEFNPSTLETRGVLKDLHNKCQLGCAHPRMSNTKNKIYSLGIDFLSSRYVVSTISSQEQRIEEHDLCSIKSDNLSYMHSFGLTEDYIILAEFPFVLKPIQEILRNQMDFILHGYFEQNGLDSYFSWDESLGTWFTVISSNSGEIVGRWHSPESFFSFHHLNAFVDSDNILKVDMVAYDKPFFEDLNLKSLRAAKASSFHEQKTYVKRCEIHLDSSHSSVSIKDLSTEMVEMPSWNEKFQGMDYTFCYGVSNSKSRKQNIADKISSYLVKVNLKTKQYQTWEEEYCAPGEALFIPKPGSSREDDGVLMSLVFDNRIKKSFILWLDAASFKELGRAVLPIPIPAGIHGQWWW